MMTDDEEFIMVCRAVMMQPSVGSRLAGLELRK